MKMAAAHRVAIGSVAAFFILSGSAWASCHSTPVSKTFADARDDQEMFGADLLSVTVSIDAACRLTVVPKTSSSKMYLHEAAAWAVDIDGDASTGLTNATPPAGADVVVFRDRSKATLFRFSNPTVNTETETVAQGGIDSGWGTTVNVSSLVRPGSYTLRLTGSVSYQASRTYKDSAPDDGSMLELPVVIAVDSQPARSDCVVPSAKGRTVAQARAALKRAGCTAGAVVKRRSAGVKHGRVVGFSSPPGRLVSADSKLRIFVSSGSSPR